MKKNLGCTTARLILVVGALGLNCFLGGPNLAARAEEVASPDKDNQLELYADLPGPMLRGVTLSHSGRVFVAFPRIDGDTAYTLAELKDGKPVPYPDAAVNTADKQQPADHFFSVMSAIVDGKDRLWLADTGRADKSLVNGAPKLVGIDLATNKICKTIVLTSAVVTKDSILHDLRYDGSRGKDGVIYISDAAPAGKSAILVVDLATGKCLRRLSGHTSVQAESEFIPFIHGRPMMRTLDNGKKADYRVGVAGLAVKPDGKLLYYCPQASRQLYSVDANLLNDPKVSDLIVEQSVKDLGPKSGASDGLECDKEGNIYFTDFENSSVWKRKANGSIEKVVHDTRLVWPDSLWIAHDGYLYVSSSHFNERASFNEGNDKRSKSYQIYRYKVTATPRD